MRTDSDGISLPQLQGRLALGWYKVVAAQLRHAMSARDPRSPAGMVDVDEATPPLRGTNELFLGGRGRPRQDKMLLGAAVEIESEGPGRTRLGKVANYFAASLHGFVDVNLAQGATIETD
ncbi:hypothetical protein [Methylocystis sp. ATCC 49242]|uniref:hypothetical protein n=1 Tax=Methylocystis sp. ATCC 49242 TaxID=622637 RepID=UPI000685D64B|nr:hypothetical protein [Methylocystis sp. ATCC 49242]